MSDPIDRGEFFSQLWHKTLSAGLEIFGDSPLVKLLEKERSERPPGAHRDDSTFQKLCTGCDACMVACPVNVIMIEDLETRHPLIYPDKDPCIHCEDTPCIKVCETGALSLSS